MPSENRLALTLLFREYCSLCRKMRNALLPYQAEYGFDLEIIDVDSHPQLEEKYNELVPVLLHGHTEICHWFLDEPKLQAFLHACRQS